MSATGDAIDILENATLYQTPSGSTNFEAGLTLAFDLFDRSTQAGRRACARALLFMTDGQPTTGLTGLTQLLTLVQTRNAQQNAVIFSYALGAEADITITKALACATGGIFQTIPDGGTV